VIEQRLQQISGGVIAPERRSPEYLAQFLAAELKSWEARSKRAASRFDAELRSAKEGAS
jgi:hypothetical protein